MIFNRTPDNNEVHTLADKALADYYSLSNDKTKGWCNYDDSGLTVTLPFAVSSTHKKLERWLIQALAGKNVELDEVTFTTHIKPAKTQHKRINKVKNIIAVASGKGGVGKSTTSINLAFALMQEGAKVGILDADIYGPSVPIMLGNPEAHPQSEDNRHMIPLESHGLVANSIGYLVPAENATIWRGPMVSRALQQLVNETLWPELDYLIVDMPPGTGDIQLTLAQQVPVSAAVVVTTPQDLALADAIKGIAMFEKVDIPVLGLVENMSYYQCKACGHREEIFASKGGAKLAKQYDVALLGQLPLDVDIRKHADGGEPILLADPKSGISDSYRYAARRISRSLAINLPADGESIEFVEKH